MVCRRRRRRPYTGLPHNNKVNNTANSKANNEDNNEGAGEEED